jgi:predicted TIM-barrel fold metal-dependent hydrolase
METNVYDLGNFDSLFHLPIIDGHLHVWKGFQPQQIWDTLNKAGAQRCNALSLNNFDRGGTLNTEALLFKKVSNGRAYAFGSLDYTDHLRGKIMKAEHLVEQAKQLKASGFDGIKMWEGKPLAYITLPDQLDGPFFEPYFAWMEERSFPIILHLADAPRLWDPSRKGLDLWSFAEAPYPSRHKMYAELETVLKRHPHLKIIFAHFLFLWNELDEARRILETHPSIAFDLTPGVEGYAQISQHIHQARQLFIDRQDQIIYGTDIGALPLLDSTAEFDLDREARQPWLVRTFLESNLDIPFPKQIGVVKGGFADQRLRGLALPQKVLEKIYYKNFEAIVGATPSSL